MNTGTDIVSMDVIWSRVLQVYVRCHLRGGALTLLLGVANEGNLDFGIREVFLVESGIWENFACGIKNHWLWNLECH